MTNPHTVKNTLTSATALLNNDEAVLEAQLLLQHLLKVNRAWLITHENDVLNGFEMANFNALIARRANGEPIAYILGYREFYGLKLKVTPDTLIPRPDTETLVEAALAKIPLTSLRAYMKDGRGNLELTTKIASSHSSSQRQTTVLDLGTGTGAIALAIAHNRPDAFVTAVDASTNALKIAQENAQDLTVLNCQFLLSDWFCALNGKTFDVIVSNPPYIEANDAHLNQGDLRFEPLSALASGADGLDDIKHIIANAPQHLNPLGWLLLEHGYNQAAQVTALLNQAGFSKIETIKDLGGNDRVTLGIFY